MRRTPLVALFASVLLAAPATAKPPATIADPKGDWAVGSQDIVATRLEGLVRKGTRTLHGTMTLAAAPDAATTYYLGFHDGVCNSWQFSVYGLGTPAQSAMLSKYVCGDAADPNTMTGTSTPATVTVRGTVVDFTTPYTLSLRRGTKLAVLLSAAATGHFVAVGVGTDMDTMQPDGDWAYGEAPYVLP